MPTGAETNRISSPPADNDTEEKTTTQVQGTLVPVGQNPLGDLEVKAISPGDTSSTITSDGSFFPSVASNKDTLKVLVDAPASEERTFHPALFRASTANLQTGVNVLMVPLEWTVQEGWYRAIGQRE